MRNVNSLIFCMITILSHDGYVQPISIWLTIINTSTSMGECKNQHQSCFSEIHIHTFEASVTDIETYYAKPNVLISLTLFMTNLNNKRKYMCKGQQTSYSNKAIRVPVPNLYNLKQSQAKFLVLSGPIPC